ncbi:hypothetical protein TIFTF001_028183 [Ficus carica]|uniref:Uncharacterized protein n=1 Tax=Ficus carica TaxID=3494 RepID=A0AA88J0V5_FICCA|nr:hypothetical protein TIFTF001_028183 [Ficus carica]
MAEVVVGQVIDKLLSLLTEEARLLTEVDDEVMEMARELGSILSVLKDADKRAETEEDGVSDGVKSWVQDLREVAFHVADVVTDYTHHMAEQPRSDNKRSFVEHVREISCFKPFPCSSINRRHDLARQIQNIKMRLTRVLERSKSYGSMINSVQQAGSTSNATQRVVTSYDPRGASRYLREDELVGIEVARDRLVGVLLDESSQRTVIPVVGMGGSGKSTLTHQVYDLVKVKFQCHAWVEVPRQCRREELLRILIRELFESTKVSVPSEINAMDGGKLTDKLREYLKEKKYLVVFDDVWNEEFWGDIEHALSDDKVGGRIMITTRNMQVAKFCESFSSVHIHEMQHLPVEKAWELFCKRTFSPGGCCPKELEKISGDIVERCEGLPLAIVVIAGLLSRKNKTIHEWQRFHASLSSELKNNVQLRSITKILSLSYYDLPYNLKSCLLYFGMFPRGHSIRNGRLIRQWIAEGFIKAVEDKTLEDVAQEYMNELINRSLVEVSESDVTGKARECRVHDLLHEIILTKKEEVCFCQVWSGSTTTSKFRGTTRRLSIKINSSTDDLHGIKFPHAHSAIFFCEDETVNNIVPVFVTNFKFLKVLDFEDAPCLDHLPEEIGRLFDLRYLSVRGTKLKVLPKAISKLENLETLDLRKSFVCELPADLIKGLCKLRNFYALNTKHEDEGVFGRGWRGIKVVGGIGFLKALQKLLLIEVGHEGVDDLFKELSNLTQLRTLGIYLGVRSKDWWSVCGCIEKMQLLESLFVSSSSENEIIDLESMSSPPKFLRNINLVGRQKKLPEWFTHLQSTLVKLRLQYSMLEDDPLEVLQNMHNLLHLQISNNAYVGEQLCFKDGMFPKLKKLHLIHLSRLRSLITEETALPMLEELWVGPCPEMKDLPSGLQHLKKLKTLVFNLFTLEFIFFQDFQTVSHVPLVGFIYKDVEGEIEWITLPDILSHQQEWIQENEEEKEEATCGTTIHEKTDQQVIAFNLPL